MFNSITIDNFRGIKHLQLDGLKQVNLFVGGNNSGKTSVMEALFVMSSPHNPRLLSVINELRNIPYEISYYVDTLFFGRNTNEEISFCLIKDNKVTKKLKVKAVRSGLANSEFDKASTITPLDTFEIEGSIKCNGSVQEFSNNMTIKIESISQNGLSLSRISEVVKKPIELTPPAKEIREVYCRFFASSRPRIGSNTVQTFGKLIEQQRDEELLKSLQIIEPSLTKISISAKQSLLCALGGEKMLPIEVMGDGFNKAIIYLLAIIESENGIILLDEIENGLHVFTQIKLWKLLFKTAKKYNVQVFATTHSLDCLNALSEISQNNEDLSVFRLFKKGENHDTSVYDSSMLKTALESNWEIR